MFTSHLSRAACLAVAIFSVTASLNAQKVRLIGEIRRSTRVSGEFVVACTNVNLKSSKLDLRRFVGLIVDMSGQQIRGSRILIDVESIAKPTAIMRLGGDRRIGGKFVLSVTAASAEYYYMFVALGPGFVPLEPISPVLAGTLLLSLNPLFLLAAGHIDKYASVQYPIPKIKELVGLQVHFQTGFLGKKPPLLYTNATCTKILSAR